MNEKLDHPTRPDIKVAGCSFYELCSLPKRERKAHKRRLQSPSYHLTSEAHLGFVRSVLAKRQKVEEGRQHRKIAAEKRKAKSKTNAVVTDKREKENCNAGTKVTQKEKKKTCRDSRRKRKPAVAEQPGGSKKMKVDSSRPMKPGAARNDMSTLFCPACDEAFVDPPTEDWIQCCRCDKWWHEECIAYEGGSFQCDLCG